MDISSRASVGAELSLTMPWTVQRLNHASAATSVGGQRVQASVRSFHSEQLTKN